MATIEQYEDIQGWQKARELTKFVYAVTKQKAFARDFGLKDQIRRAAIDLLVPVLVHVSLYVHRADRPG